MNELLVIMIARIRGSITVVTSELTTQISVFLTEIRKLLSLNSRT